MIKGKRCVAPCQLTNLLFSWELRKLGEHEVGEFKHGRERNFSRRVERREGSRIGGLNKELINVTNLIATSVFSNYRTNLLTQSCSFIWIGWGPSLRELSSHVRRIEDINLQFLPIFFFICNGINIDLNWKCQDEYNEKTTIFPAYASAGASMESWFLLLLCKRVKKANL